MKACAIVSGGSFSPLDGIGRADFVIACDKGCEYTAACGIKPDLLVGDFDSYTGEKPSLISGATEPPPIIYMRFLLSIIVKRTPFFAANAPA